MPLALQFGAPLFSLELCKRVCAAATAARFLQPAARAAHTAGQCALQAVLRQLVEQYGSGSSSAVARGASAQPVELPTAHLAFDGVALHTVDLSACSQGAGGVALGV